jgi:hypothetical protein
MLCASVSLGVVNYLNMQYSDIMRLNYAVSDAQAFYKYVCQAWPDHPENHVVLVDQEATLEAIANSVNELQGLSRTFDVFFLYLSGHGEINEGGDGWFCLWDAVPGKPSLNSKALDSLLRQIKANYVLVFIDCCHAEAISSGCHFFNVGTPRQGGLLIASARYNQKAWEVESLQRSIFSDVLLRGLSSGTELSDGQGLVDVEGKLIPYLRQQVPMAASALKRGAEQTIVTNGFLANTILLPVISGRSLGRPLTIAETIRAGVRRVVIAAVCVAVISLICFDLLIYHFVVDSNGKLLVRPGFATTYNLLPVHLTRTVDTNLMVFDLNPRDNDFLSALSTGSLWGVATHRDSSGLKPWLAKLLPSLVSHKVVELRALTNGDLPVLDPDKDEPPTRAVRFLSLVLQRSISELGAQAYPVKLIQETPCQSSIDHIMNFELMLPGSAVFARDMDWIAQTASDSSYAQAAMLKQLIKVAAYRSYYEDDWDKRIAEFHSFVAVVERLSKASNKSKVFDDLGPHLHEMQGTWCSLHASLVKGVLGDEADSVKAEVELLSILKGYDRSTQGDLLSTDQKNAILSLGEISKRRKLSLSTIMTARQVAEKNGQIVSDSMAAVELLTSIASFQELDPDTIDSLFNVLTLPVATKTYEGDVAAKILSRNYKYLDTAHKKRLREWLEVVSPESEYDENIHEALGFLAKNEMLPASIINMLVSRLSAVSRFPSVATDYRGATIISVNGDAATVALARAAQVNLLDNDIPERLASLASRRHDLKDRGEIVIGLAHQWYGRSRDICSTLVDRLLAVQNDSVRRSLEIEVAAYQFSNLPDKVFIDQLHKLLKQWHMEVEPEQKIALAELLGSIEHY